MSTLNLKQLLISLAVVLGLLVVIQILSGMFTPAITLSDLSNDVLDSTQGSESHPTRDFSTLYARYEAMQPEPELKNKADEDAKLKAKTDDAVNKVKKVLRANFQGLNDDSQIGLIAVFEKPEKFAVLQLINYQSGQSEFRKLSQGSKIGNYELSEINSLSVLLSNQSSQIELSLFKPKN